MDNKSQKGRSKAEDTKELREAELRLGDLLAVQRSLQNDLIALKQRRETAQGPGEIVALERQQEEIQRRLLDVGMEAGELKYRVDRASRLTEEQREDAARLKAIYEARKAENPSLTQESLAVTCGWKTQSAVTQYLNAMVPLNLDALIKFSLALDAPIEEISPSLASRIHSVCPVRDLENLSAEALDIARMFDKLTSQTQRAAVLAQLQAFLNP